jgi:sugar phosphate isomerase/epimerase
VCTRDVAAAVKYGFDYIEPGAADLSAMSVEQFRQFSHTVLSSPIRCRAFNGFIRRPDLKVVGDGVRIAALREYADLCLARCRALGASIVVEPLRHQESNILNTGSEALAMVRQVKHPNVRMIIDYFHLREENEDPRILEKARQEIVHIHFANPHGRLWPHDFAEDDHYSEFFRLLTSIGYNGGISIEGRGSFERDGEISRSFFRQALAST